MGMYDDLTCHYPLPGQCSAEAAGFNFQTKDLDCLLAHYIISKDGRLLVDRENEEQVLVPHTGSVCFYGSNIVAYNPHYTVNGEDAIQVEYIALFQNGAITHISQSECEVSPAPAVKDKPPWRLPSTAQTEEEKAQKQSRRNEPLTGKTIFVRYGGPDSAAREAVVVAEDDREIVARYKTAEFGQRHLILYRSDRDRLFFDSPEAAQTYHDTREREFNEGRQAEIAHHAALLAKRKSQST